MRRLRNNFAYYWPQQDLIIIIAGKYRNGFTVYHSGFFDGAYVEFEQFLTLGPV